MSAAPPEIRDATKEEGHAIIETSVMLVRQLCGPMDLAGSIAFSVVLSAANILYYTAPAHGRQMAVDAVRAWLKEMEKHQQETELRELLRSRVGLEANLDD